jgi:hypothetical protein
LPPCALVYPKRNSRRLSDWRSQAGRELPVPHVLDPFPPPPEGSSSPVLGHVRVALAEAGEGAGAATAHVEAHAVLVLTFRALGAW